MCFLKSDFDRYPPTILDCRPLLNKFDHESELFGNFTGGKDTEDANDIDPIELEARLPLVISCFEYPGKLYLPPLNLQHGESVAQQAIIFLVSGHMWAMSHCCEYRTESTLFEGLAKRGRVDNEVTGAFVSGFSVGLN